jgi:hypothetical protein
MILHAGKRIENRGWAPSYRGPLLIHASKWYQAREIDETHNDVSDLVCAWAEAGNEQPTPTQAMYQAHRGGIVGVCELVDMRRNEGADPWEVPGALGLVLANPRPLPFVPFKGALGLFDVPDALMRGVL